MDRGLRDEVWQRAAACCEHCRMPQIYAEASHEIDHVIAEKHHGLTALENLALACFHCNNHKGPNIAGVDPETGELTRLYHPRQDEWTSHFQWNGPVLVGRTAIGRATIDVLAINVRHRVGHRQALIEEGVFPLRGDS
jgi:hypothetical protein